MSDNVIRLALMICTMTGEQIHVLRGLVDAAHSGEITTAQPDWEARLETLAARLRAEYAERDN